MSHSYPLTVSGPFGQYTVEAIIDTGATFTAVPAPALIEMGIEPVRVVRVAARPGEVQFRQLGRALTAVGGQEDVVPVLFGDPGRPCVIGSTTLAILLLGWDSDTGRMLPLEAQESSLTS